MVKGIIQRQRVVGSFKYAQCPKCNKLLTIDQPSTLKMPYCAKCGKIVLDASQQYCCWCGVKLEGEDT